MHGKVNGFEYGVGRTTRGGFHAYTRVELGVDRRVLRVSTEKSDRGGVTTYATVVQMGADGVSFSCALGRDYSKAIAHAPAVRATEKAIVTAHERALLDLEPIVAECRARYAPAVTVEEA